MTQCLASATDDQQEIGLIGGPDCSLRNAVAGSRMAPAIIDLKVLPR